MIARIGTLGSFLLCACEPAVGTGELGRAQFAFCDLDAPQSRPECRVSTPLAAGAEAILFVRSVDDTPVAALLSDDPSVLAVAPSGIAGDLFLLQAYREGDAVLSAMDAGGEPIDRVVLEVRDTATIGAPTGPVVVPPGGAGIVLPCFASDGRRLIGLGATTASGASVEVPLEIVRAQVESIALSVVETTLDQGRVAAEIELEAGRRGCCEWSVGPAGGPVSIRRAECDYLLVESTAVGVPTEAEVECTVLDRSESIEIVVGVE